MLTSQWEEHKTNDVTGFSVHVFTTISLGQCRICAKGHINVIVKNLTNFDIYMSVHTI